jgi:hypothetical protein
VATQHSPVSATPQELVTMEAVAVAFRQLLIWFGVQQLAAIFAQVVTVSGTNIFGINSPLAVLANLFGWVVVLAPTIVLLVWVYRLTSSMESKAPWAWLIAMFFPCLNLLFLLMVNSNASAWCNRHGIAVGLLGPSTAAIQEVRRRRMMPPPPPVPQPPPG